MKEEDIMGTYRKSILFFILFFLFGRPFCYAAVLPVFNPADAAASPDYFALTEKYRIENMFFAEASTTPNKPASVKNRFTAETLHKYLGYTTVFLAGLTAVANGDNNFHYGSAYSTVAASLGAITTGYLAHGDRFTFEYGVLTEDNEHIVLGTIGAIGCIVAVILADEDGGNGHDGLGVGGGVSMALSVVRIKF